MPGRIFRGIGRALIMLLGPVLRMYFGSVRDLFGWAVQAVIVAVLLVFSALDTGSLPVGWMVAGTILLAVSGVSIWLRRRWPKTFDRFW